MSDKKIHYGLLPDRESIIFMRYDRSKDFWNGLSVSERLPCNIMEDTDVLRLLIAFKLLAVNAKL